MSPMVLITLALAALSGCGGGKPIKAEDRASITSVSVAKAVKIPDEPIMVGSEAGLSILFGAAGGAAAGAAGSSNAKSFADFLRASGIDIGAIVREQFTEQLKARAFYGPRLSPDGEYRFVLDVKVYGINKTNTFSSQWVPNLRLDYQLLSPSGKVVAEDWAMIPPFSDLPTFTAEEMKANPQALKKAFEKAAAYLSAKLVPKD
jgi:hypothetical protein